MDNYYTLRVETVVGGPIASVRLNPKGLACIAFEAAELRRRCILEPLIDCLRSMVDSVQKLPSMDTLKTV